MSLAAGPRPTRSSGSTTITAEMGGVGQGDLLLILSVEDRPELQHCVRGMIAQALQLAHVLVCSSSVDDAIALLESFRFDLVISDYQIGASSGEQIVDYLRARRPEDLERFVFFTGSEEARGIHPKTIDKGIRVEAFIAELRHLTANQLPWPSSIHEKLSEE